MGCQKEMTSTIRARQADYLLAVKNNRCVPPSRMRLPSRLTMKAFEYIDRTHGRVVIQYARTIENTRQVDVGTWKECKRPGQVVSLRIKAGQRQIIELRSHQFSRTDSRAMARHGTPVLGNREGKKTEGEQAGKQRTPAVP